METLASQLEDAVSNVTISPDKQKLAIAAHTEVRNLLESDAVLREWGVDSILIGSYARQTGRHPGKDVDIFLRFTKLWIRDTPSVIYDRVAQLLIRQYGRVEDGGRVTLQARSVKVDFGPPSARPDLGFSVDAVPAVPWGEHWGIPARDRTDWSDANKRWMKTSPVAFADASAALSTRTASPTVGGPQCLQADRAAPEASPSHASWRSSSRRTVRRDRRLLRLGGESRQWWVLGGVSRVK